MKWVNRVGIVLEFLSFWFAAPDILGEERLRALERRVERGIRALPFAIGAVAAALVVVMLQEDRWVMVLTARGLNPFLAKMVVELLLGLAAGVPAGYLTSVVRDKVARPFLRILADDRYIRRRSLAVGAVLFVVGLLSQLIATLEWELVKPWVNRVGIVLELVSLWFATPEIWWESKVVRQLLRILAVDRDIRWHFLAVCTALFVAGLLLRLIATF